MNKSKYLIIMFSAIILAQSIFIFCTLYSSLHSDEYKVLDKQIDINDNLEVKPQKSDKLLEEVRSSNDENNNLNDSIKEEAFDYHSKEVQLLHGYYVFDGSMHIYSMPSEESEIAIEGVKTKVKIIEEVENSYGQTWVLIEVVDLIYKEEKALGYVLFDTLFKEEIVEEKIKPIVINEKLAIGQTLDETIFNYNDKYFFQYDFYGDKYIFYSDDLRYNDMYENFKKRENQENIYKHGIVCYFTPVYEQLYKIQIVDSDTTLFSGHSLQSTYEEIVHYYENNYKRYTSEDFKGVDNYLSFILNENYVISFSFNEELSQMSRIIVEYKY